jgi:hypothetical protein
MPTPHTLPIVRFATITIRPIIWWGKQKDSPIANRAIIAEAHKFLETSQIAQSVKTGFQNWLRAKIERDGQPRIPLMNGSVLELLIDDLGTSLDVSVHFDVGEEVNINNATGTNTSADNLCIFYSEFQ